MIQQSHDVYESEFFIDFVEKCADEGSFELRDGTGNPAPQEQTEEFQALYKEGEYRRMQEFLLENNYSLGCKKQVNDKRE